VKKGVSWLGLV